jgi:Flp pilus assembly pilin Flp
MSRSLWARFVRDERGQGLAEYCLAAAFIALLALGLYIHIAGGVQDLWNTANSTLITGNSTISGGYGTSGASTTTSTH